MVCKKCGCSCRDKAELTDGMTAKTAVLYYAQKYEARYNIKYAISWARDIKALTDICSSQSEKVIKRVIDGYINHSQAPDINSFAKFFPSFVIRNGANNIASEDEATLRNKKYLEYYSTENVRARALNGEE